MLKPGDHAFQLPREDFSPALKEVMEIDPPVVTITRIEGTRAEVAPKSGELPYWTDVARLRPCPY